MLTLAFYAVYNDCGFERHDFDLDVYDPNELCRQLAMLSEDELDLFEYSGTFHAALEDADILNDWDDQVMEATGWDDDWYNTECETWAKITNQSKEGFEFWIKQHWCIPVNLPIEEVRKQIVNCKS